MRAPRRRRLGRRFRLRDRPPSLGRRRRFAFGFFAFALLVLNARAFHLQVQTADVWRARARAQHQERMPLSAPRGTIYDRNGIPLATTREMVRVAIAPREVTAPDTVANRLTNTLGIRRQQARKLVTSDRRWIVLPGVYEIAATRELEGLRGVHFEKTLERFYPHGPLAREILGPVSSVGEPLGGIESEFDHVLRGTPGYAVVGRDASGEPLPGAMVIIEPAIPGKDLYLSIDYELQQIAYEALGSALESTGADGGDILILQPRTGEILAAVSRRRGGRAVWAAVTEPYEPGSTLKPFLVAALLAEKRAKLDEMFDAHKGRFVGLGGRVITDVHGYDSLTVREALVRSSNVVMAQLALRLSRRDHYRYLRDFGFGTITGIDYPSESAGLLRRPDRWSAMSQQSLAIGYEISVTPLQMALAYGALANGGTLVEPLLILGTRARDSNDVIRPVSRKLRQVIPPTVAQELAKVLAEAVETGTGREAALGPFRVAGKTGTARRTATSGGYKAGSYTASFAGFFPADEPQLVFVVKLDDPQGSYYGGTTAAPILRETLAAVLASRRLSGIPDTQPETAAKTLAKKTRSSRNVVPKPVVVYSLDSPNTLQSQQDTVLVPDVLGQSLRKAAAALHHTGLFVRVRGRGYVERVLPSPGTPVTSGSTVELQASPSRARRPTP